MIFTSEYSIKMPLGQALLTALVGLITVLLILAIIDVLIMFVSKIVRAMESKINASSALAPAAAEPPKPADPDSVTLEGVDEPTAAVIMAIVSDKSGIPPERLKFKSIKLVEDEKK